MSHAFISYSRTDVEVVDQVIDVLEKARIPVWIDREDIHAGRQWRAQIVEAIDKASVFILFISNNSVTSKNVLKETILAEEVDIPLILPVMIEDTEIPVEFRYQLAGTQQIHLQQDPTKGIQQLVNLLTDHFDIVQSSFALDKKPEQARVEIYLGNGSPKELKEDNRNKILDSLAQLTNGLRSKLTASPAAAGAYSVIVDMPRAYAHELLAQALNYDPRLLQMGVTSVRLGSGRRYIVKGDFSHSPTGEASPYIQVLQRETATVPAHQQPLPAKKRRIILVLTITFVLAMLLAIPAGERPNPLPPYMTGTSAHRSQEKPSSLLPFLLTASVTHTSTPSATFSSTVSSTPTHTNPAPTSFTPTPTGFTPTPTYSSTPTPSTTPTFTSTPSPIATITPSPTAIFTPSFTATTHPPTATITPSHTATAQPPTATITPSHTATAQPPTATITPSKTPSAQTPSPTIVTPNVTVHSAPTGMITPRR